MKKRTKKPFSVIRIIFLCVILILLSGAGVMGVATKINSVKITLADGYEMTVLTSKTTISEILADNNIILEKDEKVIPDINGQITETKEIKITNKNEQEIEVAKVSESGVETTLDSLLQAYNTITEKIEVVEETIPFETVTKDISDGETDTKNKVLREGQEGLKKVTYKVKYQNDVEISRTVISEEILKEPVSRIVRVQARTTSRAVNISRTTDNGGNSDSGSGNVKVYKVTAYCACAKCCGGHANGYTASGTKATQGRTVAAPSNLSFGTKLIINGKEYVVEDRGGAIKGNRIDVYVNSHAEALRWGVKYLPVEVGK